MGLALLSAPRKKSIRAKRFYHFISMSSIGNDYKNLVFAGSMFVMASEYWSPFSMGFLKEAEMGYTLLSELPSGNCGDPLLS